jgi:L-alanine-DL-glutamate epimerase-like enolase superfamily enzyme
VGSAPVLVKYREPVQISGYETFVVGTPPPHHGGRYFIFIKLMTGDGIVGYGEVYCATFDPHTVAAMAADLIERDVIGADPRSVERLFRTVYSRGFTQRPDVSLMGVFSGIEMACWDICGKAANLPITELIGGRVTDRLRTYTYLYPTDPGEDIYANRGVYSDPHVAAETAARYVQRGHTALKLDPMGGYYANDPRNPSLEGLDLAAAMVGSIRDAVGSDADILFGTHGQFTPAGALRLAHRIEPFEPLWFEEPVPPDNARAMSAVASGTRIPIAAGERLTTKYEFAPLLASGAVHIAQLNTSRAGGILESRKITAIAEAHHAQIAPHLYNGPIGAAANIAIAAAAPNFLILEAILDFSGFHADLLRTPLEWSEGAVAVPTDPGLGVELNEDIARAHPYTGDVLHLEMPWQDR